ncbi:aliphatic sulfonate ABC transporter substrate-binding protein [Kineosporia babensis]|uniref:Aliphatic sulfonate ABC transporter substrate-binding protein n=1 Tax=Kineosporia babensis TaxID=499548 RepID=A0A9X1SXU6_9ACTN|nr:aliphatic sulfonate ABC transporter substrate-binding protein [Kineosporia babensis]MCD5316194.1 aliphatic sulfonate ABC transporter substrate-binding protein [Kineosporia babensis]
MGRPRTAVTAAMILTFSALAACGGGSGSGVSGGSEINVAQSEAPADAVELSIAINPWIGYGPWYVAQAKGFDHENGIDLKFVNFVDNKDLYAAVASGRLDSTHALVSTALRFQATEVPLKVALFQDISTKADALIGAEGIGSVADLRGKKVAFEEGGGHEMLLRLALEKAGLSIEDVDAVPLAADKAGAALISGQVDAAVTYEPYISQTLKESAGASVVTSAGDFPGIISDVWEVSEKFAEENPEAVTGALAAWNKGVEFFRTNQDEAIKIVAEVAEVTPEELAETYGGVELYNTQESLEYLKSDFQPLAENILGIMKEQDSIEGDADPATLVDTSYLEGVK